MEKLYGAVPQFKSIVAMLKIIMDLRFQVDTFVHFI